jgi:hypothetical protein
MASMLAAVGGGESSTALMRDRWAEGEGADDEDGDGRAGKSAG